MNMTTFDHLTELFAPAPATFDPLNHLFFHDGYTLISLPGYTLGGGRTRQWTLLAYGTKITSWTTKRRPSLLALLKVIELWEKWNSWDWDVDCTGAYCSPPSFKTYHPHGQKFETKILELI